MKNTKDLFFVCSFHFCFYPNLALGIGFYVVSPSKIRFLKLSEHFWVRHLIAVRLLCHFERLSFYPHCNKINTLVVITDCL